jgi:hypothetical protein
MFGSVLDFLMKMGFNNEKGQTLEISLFKAK